MTYCCPEFHREKSNSGGAVRRLRRVKQELCKMGVKGVCAERELKTPARTGRKWMGERASGWRAGE